jgi:hypothetical protein
MPPNDSALSHSCACIGQVNERLLPHNAIVVETFYPVARPVIETTKLDSKARSKRPPLVIASFCPFCGVKYPETGSVGS